MALTIFSIAGKTLWHMEIPYQCRYYSYTDHRIVKTGVSSYWKITGGVITLYLNSTRFDQSASLIFLSFQGGLSTSRCHKPDR